MAGGSSLDSDALVDGWPGFWRDLQLDRIESLRVTIPSRDIPRAIYVNAPSFADGLYGCRTTRRRSENLLERTPSRLQAR